MGAADEDEREKSAPTLDEARELVRDALDEWLVSLTTTERATIGSQATRETLTLVSSVWA